MKHVVGGGRLAALGFLLLVVLSPHVAAAQDWIYTVVDGDNLWNFSAKHLDRVTRFEQLQQINHIKNPYRMKPGTKLRVPMKWIRNNPVAAEVVGMSGDAELIRADGGVEPITQSGMQVQLGDQIRTAANSTMAIKFADGSILTLHSDSLVRFDHLSAHGVTGMVDSRLNLRKGRMDARVKPTVGPGSRFEIHTPSAISAVRGTEYRANVAPDAVSSNIEVLHGKVIVTGANKQALVKAGFGTQIAQGKPPITPRKLLAPPTIGKIPEPIEALNSPIIWGALPGAIKYRVEIAENTRFDTLIWQKLTTHARITLADVPDGRYSLRVRGVDDLGLEGINAVQSIVVDARPQPPVPLRPSEGEVLRGVTPELQWTASEDAAKYRLEISADPNFKQHLVDQTGLTTPRFYSSALSKTGKYYWRLSSIAPDGAVGPVGTIRSYEIKPIPEKVTPNMARIGGDKLLASWRSGSDGQRYQVQLANDEAFKDLEIDKTLSESSIAFEAVAGQVRYLRVKRIEPDGYEGPWGAVQRVDPLADNSFWAVPILGILGLILL